VAGEHARVLIKLDLAAEQYKLDRGALTVKEGKVSGPNGAPAFSFGQLTKGQKLMKVINAQVPQTPPEQWKIQGSSVPKVDGRDPGADISSLAQVISRAASAPWHVQETAGRSAIAGDIRFQLTDDGRDRSVAAMVLWTALLTLIYVYVGYPLIAWLSATKNGKCSSTSARRVHARSRRCQRSA
jgi:hypothetical protein